MMKKSIAFTLLVYFAVALIILLSGWATLGEIGIPIFLSILSLVPLYLWQRSYQKKMKTSKEINGRPKGAIIFWVFSLFFLALLVRIPSVLLFNMPYEKAPLIYLLILTIILVERTDVSAFGFKTQKTVKALLYGIAFYAVLGGTTIFLSYLLIYVFANQPSILSFDIPSFLLSMPFQTFLVGISEEGLFRGYIQTHLQKFYTDKAVFIQSVLFGFWHFVWNISLFDPSAMALYIAATFLIGLLFGYFYSKAKNLVPLILAHGLWNSVSTGMIENTVALDLLGQTPFLNQILVWLLPYAIAAMAAFLFIKCLVKEI